MSTPPTAPPRPPEAPPKKGAIDPRFRERRIEVRRTEGRRRLRVLLILAGFFFAALLAWGISRSPLLDVDHVRITGTVHTTPADIRAAARIHNGLAMLDVDSGAAAARLRAIPWILRAHVERHWPATVTIAVVERVSVAAVPAKTGIGVVDRTGRVVATQSAAPTGLPVLLGLPPAGPASTRIGGRAADLLAVAQAMPPQVAQRVAGIAAADGSWTLVDAGLYFSAGRIRRWAERNFGAGARPRSISASPVSTPTARRMGHRANGVSCMNPSTLAAMSSASSPSGCSLCVS